MASSESAQSPVANPAPIISPQFCADAQPFELAIEGKVENITHGGFVVHDINGNILFKLKAVNSRFHYRLVLIDDHGNPIVTLRDKKRSVHQRWQVFQGDSVESSALIFSAKRASLFGRKPNHNVDVFLANNREEKVCDFWVGGNWKERSSVIYAGESTIVAKLQKSRAASRILIGKECFMVTVYPNVDYAFIVALIVILGAINSEDRVGGCFGASLVENFYQTVDLFEDIIDVTANVSEMVIAEDVAGDNDDEDNDI